MTDLVTRLRRIHAPGNYATAMPRNLPVNPDGPEAADRIETLEAERDDLQGALAQTHNERADFANLVAKLEAEITRLQRELGNQPRVRMCLPGEE